MVAMEFAWAAGAALGAWVFQRTFADAARAPALLRHNYAGREVPTAGGIAAIAGFLVALAAMAVIDASLAGSAQRTVVVVVGFGFVGVIDDMVGTHSARGLRGHLRAARHGRLSAGALKLVVGVAVAVIATVPFVDGSVRRILEVVLIAGAANVGNLFDLAPARATKAAALALVPLFVVFRPTEDLVGPLCFVAAIAALVIAELREELMLGDTGANPLGAASGLAFAIAANGRLGWLVTSAGVVVALNLAAELVSFSRVIARVPPLRILDELGRRR